MLINRDIVARIDSDALYEEDITALIPSGTSSEDSARIAEQYINSWATKILFLKNAEVNLSKNAKDINKEIEDYRSALLVFRYEKTFVEQRLDTLVSETELEEYYRNNRTSFIAANSIIKARYAKISTSSPNLKKIKSLFKSSDLDDIDELKELCLNSAEKFYDFDNNWIRLNVVARELMMDISLCEDKLNKSRLLEKEDNGYLYIVYVYERIRPNNIEPYEFCISNIEDIIISKRKQKLLEDLEINLYRDAIDNNKLKIYKNNDN